MSDVWVGAVLVVAFLVASALVDLLRRPWGWVPMGLLCVVSLLGAMELARFDHGRPDLLFAAGYVGAPVAAILGGASWGTRRFYGWPDLGPLPSRLGLWAAAILVGVLVGSHVRERDVAVTRERGDALRVRLLAWRDAHAGAWPPALEAAAPDAPRTRMGAVGPPPFVLARDGQGRAVLRFPLSSVRTLDLNLDDGTWRSAPGGSGGAP